MQGGVRGGSSITMNKITKYSIIGIIVVGCAALAYNAFMPKENSDLKEAPAKERKQQGQDRKSVV